MPAARLLVLALLLPFNAFASTLDDDADDWRLIGGMLALMQQVVHQAAHSPDPQAAQKSVDAMLAGENAEANRLASGLMDEILLDVPAEHRDAFIAIGRDLVVLARREQARSAALPGRGDGARAREEAMQARKELHAMGLRYWDEQQFLEAVKRGDRLAVELYLAARGLESSGPARNLPPAR
ncbi:MAG: hypothetical protein HYS35_00365 [Betaproteobacteria bacterium]|nr:hypothetical protein [Betaproteobacteria bacterium]